MQKRLIFAAGLVLIVLTAWQIAADYWSEGHISETVKKTEYAICIEIEEKTLYLLQDGKCIRSYPVASGASGMPSPLECWNIVEKG